MRGWLCAALLLSSLNAYGELPIAEGLGYTVQVETGITTPFITEQRGNFFGAGFLISREPPRVLTNAHVASRSVATIRVSFEGQAYQPARRVYVDPHLDLALLALEPGSVPETVTPARLACADDVAAGTEVAALGHPWDLPYTATRGIVSGKATFNGRDWLQTDAALNHGNSGGPLIRLSDGAVVGVNTARVEEDNAQNLNFAVPIGLACTILALLDKGIDPTPPSPPAAFAAQLARGKPLTVALALEPNSPLAAGDVLLAVGEEAAPANTLTELLDRLRGRQGPVPLLVERSGERRTVVLTIEKPTPVMQRRGLMLGGALLADAPLADTPRLPGLNGLLIHDVAPGSPAGAQGLGPWSILLAVNDQPAPADTGELHRFLAAAGPAVTLTFAALSERSDTWLDYQRVRLMTDGLQIVGLDAMSGSSSGRLPEQTAQSAPPRQPATGQSHDRQPR